MFKQVNESLSPKEYRNQLKSKSSLNLRRNSKFNIMAIYGALNTLEGKEYGENLSVYIASEYGCVEGLLKALNSIHSEDAMLMPFDFLNVNTNNTGFLVAQALNTSGNNVNITSEDLSFEKALELSYFEFQNNKTKEILVGGVDESVSAITNYNSIIHNIQQGVSKDGSSWMYINDKKDNAIAQIKSIELYTDIEELNTYLKTVKYDRVGLNQFARKHQEALHINKDLIFENRNNFYGTSSAGEIIDMLNEEKSSFIYISLDAKKRAYIFHFLKD